MTDSAWWVLEPVGAVGLLGLLVVGGWALRGAVRADDGAGRPLGRPLAVLGSLGWATLGLVLAVLGLVWL